MSPLDNTVCYKVTLKMCNAGSLSGSPSIPCSLVSRLHCNENDLVHQV